jgi:hypothetical protein
MSERSRAASSTLLLAVLTLGAARAGALSLRSTRAEAFLDAVRPGSRVALSSSGTPLKVENTGGDPVTLRVRPESPPPERLRMGFDPWPYPDKVKVNGPQKTLDPGASAPVELVIEVPDDRRLEGGQYQFDCALEGRDAEGRRLTLRTAVLLAPGDGDPEEVPRLEDGAGLSLSPPRGRLEGVPLGRRTGLSSAGGTGLRIANAGEDDLVVRARAARAWPEDARVAEGFTPAPNPSWLETGPAVTVRAGTVETVPLTLLIPDQPRYRGRSWQFLVAVDAARRGRKGRLWWTLFVRTADEEEARSHR